MYDIEDLKTVPIKVAALYHKLAPSVYALRKVLKALPKSEKSGYGYAYWNPDTESVYVVLSSEDSTNLENKYSNAFRSVGAKSVRVLRDSEPKFSDKEKEKIVLIKVGSAGPNAFQRIVDFSTSTPLATAISGSLLGGVGGYAGGTALQWLFPDKFKKDANKRLALLGLVAGLGPGAAQYYNNLQTLKKVDPDTSLLAPLNMKTRSLPVMDTFWNVDAWDNPESQYNRGQPGKLVTGSDHEISEILKNSFKYAAGQTGAFLRDPNQPVNVDAFNAAVWQDVGKGLNPLAGAYHTPPVIGAAASGIMSGIQQANPNRGVGVTDVIRTLAGAGIGALTARAAGGVLGTLAGLSPSAQTQLQNVGMWAGLLVPATNAILGVR